MGAHPNDQSSMQGLLRSSPPGEDQDILHHRPSSVNRMYIPTNDHPVLSYNAWAFNAHSPALSKQKLQVLGELRLPPSDVMDNSTSISRFMTDNTSSRPLVELEVNALGGIGNGYGSHLSIATSWNGNGYPSSYHESADASSTVSSLYEYNHFTAETASNSAWTGSPDGNQFRELDFGNTSPTSPGFTHGHTGGRSHPSLEVCLSPSSPGLQETWRRTSIYSTASNSGNNSPGETPEAVGAEIRHDNQGSYVDPKSIQLAPAEDERDEERDDDEAEEGHSPRYNSIPGIRVYDQDHDTYSWRNGHGYYIQTPMDIGRPPTPPRPSPPASPQRSTMLGATRHSKSGSGASQLSVKERAGLMKPYKDTSVGAAGKSHKGRGAGKKNKERQRCLEHPNKSFKHNSDFRYPPLPVPILPIVSLNTGGDQLTIFSSRSKHVQTQHTRPFLCTFHFASCTQTFGSKNEWKRHVFSQHLQLHYWRCDHVNCAERKAFFNRKDLFGQHLKRMHGPNISQTTKSPSRLKDWLGREIPEIQERCRKVRRSPPEWSKCGYCSQEFRGEGSWDLRMEHVGKHYEKDNYKEIDPTAWVMDEGLVEWAIGVGIVERMRCGNHKLICSGKDSIEGEEKRRSLIEQTDVSHYGGNDDDEDAECEYEF